MKRITAFLLSISSVLCFSGTTLALKTSSGTPKEPPSTTLVVQTSTSLSETTARQNTVTAKSAELRQVIAVKYAFGETSSRVKVLQKELGNLKVDGQYGLLTRAAHVAALKRAKLSVAIAPKAPVRRARYNISSNKEERCPQFEKKFKEYGLVPVEVFSYIAWRESKCAITAINARFNSKGKMTWALNKNGTFDSGLLQINSSWVSVTAQVCKSERGDLSVLRTLDCNLRVAKYILENGGLRNWSIYKRS